MESYLDKIIEAKAEVVVAQKSSLNIQDIKNQLDEVQPTRGFVNAIKKRNESDLISVIAEIKKASPSKGVICENFEPSLIAKQYFCSLMHQNLKLSQKELEYDILRES